MSDFVSNIEATIAVLPEGNENGKLFAEYLDVYRNLKQQQLRGPVIGTIPVQNKEPLPILLINYFHAISQITGALNDCKDSYRPLIVLAGGAATRIAVTHPWEEPADYDFFFVGCDPALILEHIIEQITMSMILNIYQICVTRHAVTIVLRGNSEEIKLKFIIRKYSTIDDILLQSDIDPCRCAWIPDFTHGYPTKWTDGKLVTIPTGEWAIKNMKQVLTPNFSENYEERVTKYALRGFDVLTPNIPRRNNLLKAVPYNKSTKGRRYGYTYLCALMNGVIKSPSRSDYDGNDGTNMVQSNLCKMNVEIPDKKHIFRPKLTINSSFDVETNALNWISILLINPQDKHKQDIFDCIKWNLFVEDEGFEVLASRVHKYVIPKDGYKIKRSDCIHISSLVEHHNPMKQSSGSFHPRNITYGEWIVM